MTKKKQTPEEYHIAKLKENLGQAVNSLNQSTRQTFMLEGVVAFLNQAIEEAKKEGA